MELSRTNLEFISGYVYGAMSHSHGYDVTPEGIKEVEVCVQAALGLLFPMKESEIEGEIENLINSLPGDEQ